MNNTTQKPTQLETAWIVGDFDFCEYVCEEHAREFAAERGLVFDYPCFTEESPKGYAYAQFFHETESDCPASCSSYTDNDPCSTWLDVALTPEGHDYVRENYPREWWHLWGTEE